MERVQDNDGNQYSVECQSSNEHPYTPVAKKGGGAGSLNATMDRKST